MGFSICSETDQTPPEPEYEPVEGLLNKNMKKNYDEVENKANNNEGKRKIAKTKIKRGSKKKNEQQLTVLSANAAQLKGKLHSFKSELKACKAGIFTVQETHFESKGKVKIEGFEIFEAIRKKVKGGTMIGVHKAMNPNSDNTSFDLMKAYLYLEMALHVFPL